MKNSQDVNNNNNNGTQTNPIQSGPGSNDNEEVIPHSPKLQNWSLTIRCYLISCSSHLFWGSYPLYSYQKPKMKLRKYISEVSSFFNCYILFIHNWWGKNRWFHGFPERRWIEGKQKQPCSGFELGSLILFPMTITIMLINVCLFTLVSHFIPKVNKAFILHNKYSFFNIIDRWNRS